jgi:hypothetical protein
VSHTRDETAGGMALGFGVVGGGGEEEGWRCCWLRGLFSLVELVAI